MMKALHSLIRFVWNNIATLLIWAWMVWLTFSIGYILVNIDNIEMRQESIENILKTYEPFNKPMDSLPSNPIPLDTMHIWGSRNSDVWKI